MTWTSDNPTTLMMGIAAGFLFGFFLRKGHLTRFNVIVNQFLLRDFTMVKVMLTAILVGSVGIYAMVSLGIIEHLPIKPFTLWANLVGGVIFGIGMCTLGFCPGTCLGAVGEGNRHALFGVLGMLVGAALYAEVYDYAYVCLLKPFNMGQSTFPSVTDLSAWWFIIPLCFVIPGLLWLIERFEQSQKKG